MLIYKNIATKNSFNTLAPLILKKLSFHQKKAIIFTYPIIIPAIVAESNDAIDPPNNAFNPKADSVFLCPGAKDPIPPI